MNNPWIFNFQSYHCSQSRFFLNLLFDQSLLACWCCIFLSLFAKNTLPSFTEITLPVAQPETMAFSKNLPAHWGWIIYWLFSKIIMPRAEVEADFFLALLQTFICPQLKQIFLICFLTKIYLPAEPAFFLAFLQKISCPVLQKLPYLWPNLRVWHFP